MDAILTVAAREREIGEYKVQMHELEQYRSKNARLHDEKGCLQADKGAPDTLCSCPHMHIDSLRYVLNLFLIINYTSRTCCVISACS